LIDIIYALISILIIWLIFDILYYNNKEWFTRRGFNLHYGFILVYRRESHIKGSTHYRRFSYLNIVFFVLALITFYSAMISSIFAKIGLIEGGARVQLLIPGINITGEQIIYFIVAVAIAAFIHEFLHAYTAVSHNLKVKSLGFTILFVVPIAFTEVDEEEFSKAPLKARITTLAAGPASNYMLALLAMFLVMITISSYGIVVLEVLPGSLAEKHGIRPGDILLKINGEPLTRELLAKYLAKDNETVFTVEVWSQNSVRNVTIHKPRNVSRLGIAFSNKPNDLLINILGIRGALIVSYMIIWLYIVNLGLAIINAAPIFISDGGKVLYEIFKNKNIGHIINTLSLAILILAVTL